MTSHTTSVILLCLESPADTISCIESLLQATIMPDTILVCDNGSSEKTQFSILLWAKSHFEPDQILDLESYRATNIRDSAKFIFIRNGRNVGFSAGNNPGIKYALAAESDFVWLLNSDTVVQHDTLEKLFSCAQNESTGIFGSTIVYADDRKTVQCAGGCSYNPLTTIYSYALGGHSLDHVLTTPDKLAFDYAYGASMFIRREVFEKCGLLNEDLFIFYEEPDLCTRAKSQGFAISWCKESIVFHKVSQTIGRADSKDRKKITFANYHENLSTLLFTRKHYPYLLPFAMVFRFLGKIATLAKRGELYLTKPLFDAYIDFFRGRNQREKYRQD